MTVPSFNGVGKNILKFFAGSVKETMKCNTQTKWKGALLREMFAISSFSKSMRNVHLKGNLISIFLLSSTIFINLKSSLQYQKAATFQPADRFLHGIMIFI